MLGTKTKKIIKILLKKEAFFEDKKTNVETAIGAGILSSSMVPMLPVPLLLSSGKFQKPLTTKELFRLRNKMLTPRELKEFTLKKAPNPLLSHVNPTHKAIVINRKGPAEIVAHEFGHLGYAGRKAIGKVMKAIHGTRGIPGLQGALMLSSLFGSMATAYDPSALSSKLISAGVPLAFSPILFDEARASTRAFKALKELRGWKGALKGLPGLVAAGATYGLTAAAPYLAGKTMKYFNES